MADQFFAEDLWRIIKYESNTNGWCRQLKSKLQYLVTSKKSLLNSDASRHMYDIGIVTALRAPELQFVLDLFTDLEEVTQPNDPTIYYRGYFKDKNKKLSVIAACASQMGMPASAVISTKIIAQFHPRYLVMTGIAAGVKGGAAKIGDILIADQSWDYESGKHKIIGGNYVFEPDPRYIPLDVRTKARFIDLQANNSFLSDIQNKWRGTKLKEMLQVHIGPVASGAAVIQNEELVDNIVLHNRKIIGLDMETYSVFFAAENSARPRPIPISIKSVCDFADISKVDDYQNYAAYTSAQYLYHFALEYLNK